MWQDEIFLITFLNIRKFTIFFKNSLYSETLFQKFNKLKLIKLIEIEVLNMSKWNW